MKGIRYERWEIDEIKIEVGDSRHGAHEAGALLARIGERLEHLGDHMIEEALHHKHHQHK
jgi:hypothetical protein